MESASKSKLLLGQIGYELSKLSGFDNEYLENAIEHGPTSLNLSNIDVGEKINNYNFDGSEKKVLIPLIQGRNGNYALCSLGHAFRTRGYEPIALLCDSGLGSCFRKKQDRFDNMRCELCQHYSDRIVSKFNLSAYKLSEFNESDATGDTTTIKNDLSSYRGVDLSKYAMSSCRKYMKRYTIDLDDEFTHDLYNGFLHTGKRIVDASYNIFENMDIRAVIGGDCGYVYDGAIFAVAEKYGIPSTTPSQGWTEGTRIFGYQKNRAPFSQFTDKDYLNNVVSTPLEDKEIREIDKFMDERSDGKNVYFDHNQESHESIHPESDFTVGIFSNLLWDGSLIPEEGAFDDPFSWLKATVDELSNQEKISVIIKPHPAEYLRGTNESVYNWVKNEYRPLPDNIRLLKPDTDINAYSLMKSVDLGITYTSTVGIEMAYWGKPVIVASDTHYRNLGFTYNPDSDAEYRSLLNKIRTLESTNDMRQRAQRYAHFLFLKKQIEFPYNVSPENGQITISHDDLKPGNENIDLIVNKILSHDPVSYGK